MKSHTCAATGIHKSKNLYASLSTFEFFLLVPWSLKWSQFIIRFATSSKLIILFALGLVVIKKELLLYHLGFAKISRQN